MPKLETIKGLERGLQVLKFLHTEPISSLHEIYTATSISKPSLLRILNTLEQSGMVARRLADGRYRLSLFTDVVRKLDRYDRVAEAAAPVLAQLLETVKWPADLFVPAGDSMERRETNMPQSPFMLQGPQSRVGGRVGWLMTGVGRAYLAWCPEKEREAICAHSENPTTLMIGWRAIPRNSREFSPRCVGGVMRHAMPAIGPVDTERGFTMTGQPQLLCRCSTADVFMVQLIFAG
ncbi:helix-turn-helix domain-containing protein [Bradyrhizobium sp. RDT46]|uniref:helix-turn-helix domain-containing protein n=1 Tax=Bradyrhizobium sp. RDT46 TaxID=3341829 RepID=UPI0035C734C7